MVNAKAIIKRISEAVIADDGNGTELMSTIKDDISALRREAVTDIAVCDTLLQMAEDNERLKTALKISEEDLREAVVANKSACEAKLRAARRGE